MALIPCEFEEGVQTLTIKYSNADAVSVAAGASATVAMSKEGNDDTTGYTLTGISSFYSGSSYCTIANIQSNQAIIRNHHSSTLNIPAKSITANFRYIKIN